MNENVNVCITPKGDKPVLHFSQFDNERVFTVTVLADDGESAAVLTGLDIEFRLRKTDSHVVTIAPESVSDNVITFKTTEQMCACCGQNIASVTLMKDDMNIATLDILVDIQRDILSGGLTSESDIRNLTSQIEQIVPEVIGDDYYNKTEVDELIADIPTFDPTNYYDKVDVDVLLEDKADATDVYTKSEVYNKSEADDLLSAKMDNIGYNGIVDDAAIISFNTDSDAPLSIIKGNITPVQSGSGTPSPDNVRPISGFSALNVTRTGKNFLNGDKFADNFAGSEFYSKDTVNKTVTFANSTTTPYHKVVFEMPFKANTQYTFIFNYTAVSVNRSLRIGYTDGTNSEIYFDTNESKSSVVVTSLSGKTVKDLYLSFLSNGVTTLYYDECGIFEGVVTLADFEPYNGQTATVNFGQTVYGGVADVTNGKVTLTHGYLFVDGSTSVVSVGQASGLNYVILSNTGIDSINTSATHPIISNEFDSSTVIAIGNAYITGYGKTLVAILPDQTITTVAQANTWFSNNPAQFLYELATPIEISTTPVTVSSIAGDNNIYIDTGNLTEIAYFEGVEDNLIKLIKACQI